MNNNDQALENVASTSTSLISVNEQLAAGKEVQAMGDVLTKERTTKDDEELTRELVNDFDGKIFVDNNVPQENIPDAEEFDLENLPDIQENVKHSSPASSEISDEQLSDKLGSFECQLSEELGPIEDQISEALGPIESPFSEAFGPIEDQLSKALGPIEEQLSERLGLINLANIDQTLEANSANEKVECLINDAASDDLCSCEDCGWKDRDISAEDLQEMMNLRHRGMDLRQYVRHTFNYFMETSGFSLNASSLEQPPELESLVINPVELQESVVLLCDKVPYHLFMWLVGQAQEFIMGVKVQLLTLLYDHSVDNLAEVFITKLLDGYYALLATAVHISGLLKPLHKELFSKVNLTWECINKILYQNYVYSDPLIQNNLLPFIGQLRKHLPTKGSEYHDLVHRYLAFDKEITKTGTLCPEIERLIDKYNAEQVTDTVMKKVREDFERFSTRLKIEQQTSAIDNSINKLECLEDLENCCEADENMDEESKKFSCSSDTCVPAVEIQSMFNDWKKSPQQRLADLVEALNLSSALEEEDEEEEEEEEDDEDEDDDDDEEEEEEDEEEEEEDDEDEEYEDDDEETDVDLIKDDKLLNVSTQISAMDCVPESGSCDKQICKCHSNKNNENICCPMPGEQSSTKALTGGKILNSLSSSCALPKQKTDDNTEPLKKILKTTVAQSAQTQTRHSTTQTPNLNHSQAHTHRHHHQGRLSPTENADGSDSGSSHDDSCSITNSPTPREANRHCDCCYCEVFGHGVPSVAPVSRNYNEMRERLRQLLSKKKAKCKSSCNPHTKNTVEVSSSSSSLSSISSTSSTIINVDSTTLQNSTARSIIQTSSSKNIPLSSATISSSAIAHSTSKIIKERKEPWSLEAAIEFVEGNQNLKKDSKKAEKKARQKQRKLDEQQKKLQEEQEQLRLLELQKKTPEVTITVVKQNTSQKSQQQKKSQISIVPAVSNKQQTNSTAKKSKNSEIVNNNINTSNKVVSSTKKTIENVNKKKTVSIEKVSQIINLNNVNSKTIKTEDILASLNSDPDAPKLTKKERQKLKRELEKQEIFNNGKSSDNKLQIVTIKRIMECENTEPTVTITLKGQTPAQDKVLFTLINGQNNNESSPEKNDQNMQQQKQNSNKKKKNKDNNSQPVQQAQSTTAINNNKQLLNQQQQTNKKQQAGKNNNVNNSEKNQKNDSKITKQQQPVNNSKEKLKNKQEDLKNRQQQQQNTVQINETKNNKSKKDKKNNENKENILKQSVEVPASNKKSNKASVPPQLPPQKNQSQVQQSATTSKATKTNKNQNKNNTVNNPSNQVNTNSKGGKQSNNTNVTKNQTLQQQQPKKIDNQKSNKLNQNASKQQKQTNENEYTQNNYRKENENNSINIENLKLPPGITITKVDAPVKSIPIKSNSANNKKPTNSNSPKQTTIIAAPLSGQQPSSYGSSQGTGNVIVVDTGRLKQDLGTKNDKETSKESQSKKKKKKKNKTSTNTNVNEKNASVTQVNKSITNDYMNPESAKISHNPATNMVTIRNPAFCPAPPKVEQQTLSQQQQAAIIKVAENGMVTIRSPALQQAINAGLAPPSKPDYVIKGNITDSSSKSNNSQNCDRTGNTDITDLRKKYNKPEHGNSSMMYNSTLPSIQISKVANGQAGNIPEQGINLKGTSVTLTKIRTTDQQQHHQNRQQQIYDETKPIGTYSSVNAVNGAGNASKNRKKKKRGTGVRQNGDDWNLVESVFTPRDLEDGEMDDAERELEAFKRFCLQSVPPPRKEKVNLNLKDIVLKKKSSTSSAAAVVAAT